MKHKLFILAILLTSVTVKAFNFSAVAPSGQYLYYTIVTGGVIVTFPYNGYSDYYQGYSRPTGDLTIPPTVVSYSGTTYSVIGISAHAFDGCSGLTSVTIPSSVTSIGDSSFYNCSGMTSVTIGNSVTSIGSYAFAGCGSLTSVTIPDSVTNIGNYAFSNCSDLTFVTIPNSVTSIGNYAFSNCSGLTSIIIPNSVTSISGNPFNGCSGLNSIVVEAGNTHYDSRNNCNAIIQTDIGLLIRGCQNTVIPDGVTAIGLGAFNGCSSLISVTIPDSVTSIGTNAFSQCSGLTSLTIGNSVTSIGNGAFSGCSGLTSVTIPNSVTSIGSSAFSNCHGLTSIIIPDSVTSIGTGAFSDCIGLTSVTIGKSVTNIGFYAFSNCTNLTEIHSKASVAPTYYTHYNPFSNVHSTIPVYIPCGSQMSYYSSWSYFSNFIEDDVYAFSATTADSAQGVVIILTSPTCQTPTAVFYAVANTSYVFDHWSDGATNNPRTLTLSSDTSITAYFSSLVFDTVFVHDTTFVTDTLWRIVHDTIYLPQYIHDTVYIHDTIVVGVDEVDAITAKIYTSGGQIVVEGAEGNQVWLYDVNGRLLATKQDYSPLRFDVPALGAYLVKIGNHAARRVVVIR